MTLEGKRIACLVGDDYEDLEVWYPVLRLREEGALVDLVGLEAAQSCKGKHGYPAESEVCIGDALDQADTYDGLIVPGGWMPDKLRRYEPVLRLCQEMDAAGKLVATICHGPWILISARIVKGRTMTSTPGIKDDVENAGAVWVDQAAVRDGNLVSARRPPDLPDFCKLMITVLQEQ